MILKLIVFAVIFYVVYRFVGGKFPKLGGDKKDRVSKSDDKKKIEEDTLIECASCGTYVTYKECIIVKGKSYCSKECAGF